jgi:hypothetical protein
MAEKDREFKKSLLDADILLPVALALLLLQKFFWERE